MIIGTDASEKVWLVTSGDDPAAMPKDFNGAAITAHVLTKEQELAYAALPADRSGVSFDGATFTAAPPVVKTPQKSAGQLAVDALKADPTALAALKAELAK